MSDLIYSPTTFHQLFESQVEKTPDQIAVVFADKTLSYRELNQKANQLAHFLRKKGINADILVGLYVERSLEMLIGILAILKAGGSYLPLDPQYPQERLKFILQDAHLTYVLTQDLLLEQLSQFINSENHAKPILIAIEDSTINKESIDNPTFLTEKTHLAYCIYTSGSTGKPKGVLIEHRSLFNLTYVQQSVFKLNLSDRVLQFASLNFDASIWEMTMTLSVGATLYLAKLETILPGQPLLQFLQQHAITVVTLPPSVLASLPVVPLPSLRILVTAGEACSPQLIQHWSASRQFFNAYGPTEATVCATIAKYPTLETPQNLENWKYNPPIGYPIANMQVHVLDEQLQLVEIGKTGELHIGGIGLARGYLNRPDLTTERFIVHPHSKERLYKTGDRGRYLPDGQLEFLGRIDYQVKIRGFRIELGEIETVIKQFPSVQEAVVIVQEISEIDKRLIAYINVVPEIFEKTPDFNQKLRDFLKTQLPYYMLPAAIVNLTQFPLTPNGKIDRNALSKFQQTQEEELSIDDLPKTEIEQKLLKLWQDLLKLDKISVHRNFFELGGHSLLAVQLLSRISTTFQVELGITDLFKYSTIATLAIYITGLPRIKVTTLTPIRPSTNTEFPLSSNQQAWWSFEQVYPSTSAYNIPLIYELQGILHLPALEQALSHIIERHSSLRTRFRVDEYGIPQQRITELDQSPITIIDLPNREFSTIKPIIREIIHRPFNFTQESLIRIHLLRLTSEKNLLLLIFHHLIIDGWSVKILLQELMALYATFKQGIVSPLSEATYQYVDFCQWQQHWLQSQDYQRQLTYWQTQLQPLPEVLELPSERSRPTVQTFGGARQPVHLPTQLTIELNQLSHQYNVTLFTTLLAVFKVLLYRYTGHTDIIVGTSVAGRQRREWENIVGLCMNNLPLRSYPVGSLCFTDFLAQVRETVLTALQHQDLPLQKLLESLPLNHDLSRNPLFQTFFLMQNFDLPELSLEGLTVIPLEFDPQTAKLDLSLELYEKENGLIGWFEYNTTLFTTDAIHRMVGHFETLLTGIIAQPHQKIAELPLLTLTEQQQLLEHFKSRPFEQQQLVCVHESLAIQAIRTPHAIAVVDGKKSLTYHELNQQSQQLAYYLHRLGVKEEVRVGLSIERTCEMIVGLFGILKAGGAYVPLDPAYPEDRLTWIIADAQISVLVTESIFESRFTDLSVSKVFLDQDRPEVVANFELPRVNLQSLAYIIYTSGSTGQPKGVMIEHRGLSSFAQAAEVQYGLTAQDRHLQFASLSFDAAGEEIYPTLLSGATLVMRTPEMLDSPEQFIRSCQEKQLTALNLPTAYWHEITTQLHKVSFPPTIRLVIIGGEAAQPYCLATWHRYLGQRVKLLNTYGPTEATISVTAADLTTAMRDGYIVPIGHPMGKTAVYILDEQLQLVPIGVTGELYLGGPQLARGYWNRPDLTAERFVKNPFSENDSELLYKTGDLARFCADGQIEFLGRKDSQVKIRGFRVELGEIETILAQHSSIQKTVVIAHEDISLREKRLLAYIVPRNSTPTTSELYQFLKQRLPSYMIPAAFVMMESFPLNSNGKIDYRKLPIPEGDRPELAVNFVVARNPLEQLIATAWMQVLKLQKVGIHDNFFELGGDSLKGAMVINRLQAQLGEILHVVALFNAPTIAELAIYLQQNYPEATAKILGTTAINASIEEVVDTDKIAEFRRLVSSLSIPSQSKATKNPPAVFILSPPRSGSTLLRVMLAGHPRLFAPPELHLLTFNTLSERKSLFSGMYSFWGEGTIRAIMTIKHCSVEQAQQLMRDCEEQQLTTQQFYHLLQQWIGERILVDKTTHYTIDLETLYRAETDFDQPLYIHLLRHPYGMIRSFEEARIDQLYLPTMRSHQERSFARRTLAELIWVVSYQNSVEFLRKIPSQRQFHLKFEDLVNQPEEVIKNLCQFLDIDFQPAMLQPYQEKQQRMTDGIRETSRMLGDVKFHDHQNIESAVASRWQQHYQTDFLGETTWQLAESLGYSRPTKPQSRLETFSKISPTEAEQLLARIHELSDEEVDALLNRFLERNHT